MSAAHTPGPWRIAPASDYAGTEINIDAGKAGFVCLAGHRGDEVAEANARLIAAAPCLLAALKAVLSVVNVRIDDARIGVFDDARAAIKKAEGV